MARNERMGLVAVASAVLIIVSVLILWTMPADPEETADQAMTYVSIGIYIAGLALIGPVIYFMRAGADADPQREEEKEETETAEPDEPEIDDYVSDIEREFQALEMEIDREENG
jgi:hypothetical protein